jgi:hypothetical protein
VGSTVIGIDRVLMKLKGQLNNVPITRYFVKDVLFILYYIIRPYQGTKIFVLCRQHFVKNVFFITDIDCIQFWEKNVCNSKIDAAEACEQNCQKLVRTQPTATF